MEQKETQTSAEVIVSCSHLTKQYKGCLALNDVSLDIHKGDLIGLVGKNGAGKTTLIRLLTGVATPTSGTISLFGSTDEKSFIRHLVQVSAMIEQPALYDDMTAHDNLMTRCLLMGIKNPEQGYIADKFAFVGLPEATTDKRKVKDYSLGMRQRVGIAMAMVGEPQLMVLDEPTNGLDPEGVKQIRETLQKLNESGITILISSHILAELSKFAKSYIFIDKGRFVESITADELESKVGKVLILKTSDDAKALSVLLAAHFAAAQSKDSLYVHDVKEPAEVLNLLSQNAITLKGMKEEENSLEDYFVSLVGAN
jgi:ABC-2 type transport system ATP-binding protein